MKQIEDYFINEEIIKQSISGNRQVNNPPALDSDMRHQTLKDSLNAVPQAEVEENSLKTHSKNKNKPSLNSLFEDSPRNVRTCSRISIPSDISFRLKQVALYMEQEGMPHSIKTYISNVLLQHLKEYETEINQLVNKEL